MKVAICDDEQSACEQTKKLLLSCDMKYQLEMEIVCFLTGEELLNAPFDYDILFLDIRLNDKQDGIEIGKELRRKGNSAIFILETNVLTRHREGYKAGVHRYLEKPFSEEEFEEAFMSAVKMLYHSSAKLDIHYKTETVLLDVENILYIESYDRKRYVHLKAGKEQFTREILDDLEKRLPEDSFFRLNKRVLVNLMYVKKCSKREVTMEDGRILIMDREKYDDFNLSLMRFLRGMW